MTFSKNKKTNKVLSAIYNLLLHVSDTEAESRKTIKHYKESFKNKAGVMMCEHATMPISYYDIRQLYKGLKSYQRLSNEKLEEVYKSQVNYICYTFFD